MAFESGVATEELRYFTIVPPYKGKRERHECKNYRGVSLLSVVGNIYAGILAYRVCKVTGVPIDDEQGSFMEGGAA